MHRIGRRSVYLVTYSYGTSLFDGVPSLEWVSVKLPRWLVFARAAKLDNLAVLVLPQVKYTVLLYDDDYSDIYE